MRYFLISLMLAGCAYGQLTVSKVERGTQRPGDLVVTNVTLTGVVYSNDQQYIDTVIKAGTALQVQTQQVYVATAGTAGTVTGSQSNLIASALQAEGDTMQSVANRGATIVGRSVTIDSENTRTNTYGGYLSVLGSSVKSGNATTASGTYSHAEGNLTSASASYSHAEGVGTAASGGGAHAEGNSTLASGNSSHAEGYTTTASGYGSHSSGYNSVSSNATSFTWQGSDGYAEQVYGSHGNGTYNINPVGGLYGFWIGKTNLQTTLDGKLGVAHTNDPVAHTALFAGKVDTNDAHYLASVNASSVTNIARNVEGWLTYSGLTGSVTLTNQFEAPIAISGTGAVSVAFSGLRVPYPVYFTAQGFSSLTVPVGSYVVGGGSWQTNRVNHFIVWQYGTTLYLNPVITSEVE